MKKNIIFFISIIYCNLLTAAEYPNSWKMDIFCKQGKAEWYESAFVVDVNDNNFSFGPYDKSRDKNYKWKGKIDGEKIKVSASWSWPFQSPARMTYTGKFINENEAILKGRYTDAPTPWDCNGRFYKVDRAPHFSKLKYLDNATEEIIKFTSYNPGIPLTIIDGSYKNSPVDISGKLILPKEGENLPVVVTIHSSAGPSEFNSPTESWRDNFKNELLKNKIGIFEIDSFTGRGSKNTYSNQGKVSINAGEMDALVAYNILDKHPRVDAKRLGVTGLSRGGNASMMTVEKKFSDAVLGSNNYYKASLPMASDCFNLIFENPTPTPAKVLFLLGADDDYALAKFCVAYAEKMKKAGGDVEIISKKNWHHAFYADNPIVNCKDCVHFNQCQIHLPEGVMLDDEGFFSESQYSTFKKVFKVDMNKWKTKFEKNSDKPGAANKLYKKLYVKWYKKCGERGTTVGGDHGQETVDIAIPFFVENLK